MTSVYEEGQIQVTEETKQLLVPLIIGLVFATYLIGRFNQLDLIIFGISVLAFFFAGFKTREKLSKGGI